MGAVVDDPYRWLEDVSGEAALDWARGHNERSTPSCVVSGSSEMRAEALEILTPTRAFRP